MAEMIEVLEDGAENVKKFVKKNPLIVAGVGVGAVALYVLWVKSRQTSADTAGYEAIGYGGYPTVSGGGSGDMGDIYGSGSDDSYIDEILRENQATTDSLLTSITQEYDAYFTSFEDTIGRLEERAISSEEKNKELEDQIKRQNVISQMRANSELHNAISDRAMKDALHAENMALAETMGWTFDQATGNYFEGNSVVYTTSKQEAANITKGVGVPAKGQASNKYTNNAEYNKQVTESVLKSTADSGVGYDVNVDYSLAIVKAKESGASQATINALQEARQAKIDAKYGGVDPASKETQAKIK